MSYHSIQFFGESDWQIKLLFFITRNSQSPLQMLQFESQYFLYNFLCTIGQTFYKFWSDFFVDFFFFYKTSRLETFSVGKERERHLQESIQAVSFARHIPHLPAVWTFGNKREIFRQPEFEQSHYSTFFKGRIIKKVQYYDHSIVVEMSLIVTHPNQLPLEYFINKNKSKGEQVLFQLANSIQDVYEHYKTMPKQDSQDEKSESVKKCLDSLGDSMYVCILGVNKLAVSKSLLTYLQYDLEEFGIEAIKYKTIFHEQIFPYLRLFSANQYAKTTIHIVKIMKYIVQLFQNKITQNQFYKKTIMKFSDFMYSKTGVRSFCDMSFSMLNPTFFCHKINFIYYKESEARSAEGGHSELRLAIEGQQQRMRQGQYKPMIYQFLVMS